jgi:hypothetical protein
VVRFLSAYSILSFDTKKEWIIGELVNEDKTILSSEEFAGMSVKGQGSEEDGIPACLLAAKAMATGAGRV